jgi:protein-disulfide isomerase
MHPTFRRPATSRTITSIAAIAVLAAGLALSGLVRSARAADTASGAVPASARDANLKALLQKRLLIADAKSMTLGAPSPGPFPGVSSRTVTIASPEGQKAEIEVFYDASGTRGIIAQRYAVFDSAHPWEKVEVGQLDLKDRPSMGPADAPITIIEFADFECPYCAHAFSEIDAAVNNTYKGKVRLVWKNFPLNMHPWAEQAAVAAECAKQQNPEAFWGFARDLYRDQTEITPQNLRQHIDDYTKSLGLDDKAMDACILGKSADAYVQQDLKDGNTVHVNSTPTFIVNGVPVVGLPSSQTFDFVVKSQLREARAGKP